MDPIGTARNLGVGGLLAVAAMHTYWATGASWPLTDRRKLARAVIGSEEMPSASACLAVAVLLTVAGGLVAGFPRRSPRIGSLGAAGVVAVLAARGLVGAASDSCPGSVSLRRSPTGTVTCTRPCAFCLPASVQPGSTAVDHEWGWRDCLYSQYCR